MGTCQHATQLDRRLSPVGHVEQGPCDALCPVDDEIGAYDEGNEDAEDTVEALETAAGLVVDERGDYGDGGGGKEPEDGGEPEHGVADEDVAVLHGSNELFGAEGVGDADERAEGEVDDGLVGGSIWGGGVGGGGLVQGEEACDGRGRRGQRHCCGGLAHGL